MENSLNTTIFTSVVLIFFILGRILYLRNTSKSTGENGKGIPPNIKNDIILRIIISVGIVLIISKLIRYYFNSSAAEGLFIGALVLGGLVYLMIRMGIDKKIRSQILDDWKKTYLSYRIFLIFICWFGLYTLYESVKDLSIGGDGGGEFFLRSLFNILLTVFGYILTGVLIIGVVAFIPVLYFSRKTYLPKIKERIADKDYLRVFIIFLAVIMLVLIAINLAAFKIGLTSDRFWIIKDYISVLFFILATIELIIKNKKLFLEAKTKLKENAVFILFFSVWYFLGAVTIGYLLVGE